MMTEIIAVGPIENGRELDQTGGEIFDVINPATGEIVARQSGCAPEDVTRIVKSAHKAFNSSRWKKFTAAERGKLLLNLADLVEKHASELIEAELLDTGKPLGQIRDGEIPLTNNIIRFYAGAADKIEGRIKSAMTGTLNLTLFEPYGVVGGILPWNYPLVNAAMKLAPALAAGNAIVLKPSVHTPLSTTALVKLCAEAGIPEGIVCTVLGPGSEVGSAIVSDRLVSKISFTGSTSVGQSIQRQATDQLKAVNLELGGKNAIIVFADADLDRASEATLFSGFANAGQLCVSCSRLLVEQSIADQFEAILLKKIEKLAVGDPRDEATLIGPMITKSQYEIALRYITQAPVEGCKILCGGDKAELAPPHDRGYYLQPTLLSNVKPNMKVAREEIFGPCLSVIRFSDEEDALSIANDVQYGLSGSIWTQNNARAMRMIERFDTGIIWVNTMLTGYPQVPLAPHKMSGSGVELGMEGLMKYCKCKSAVIGYDCTVPVGWNLG